MTRTHSRIRIASDVRPSPFADSWFCRRVGLVVLLIASSFGLAGCEQESDGLKTLRFPIRSDGPEGMDPVRVSSSYDSQAVVLVYDTLLQYKYLVRPLELEPSLLAEMPTIADDNVTWSFRLKKGVRFIDDPCFPDGQGRELVARDVFYSWKRMADLGNAPKSWWLFKSTIKGFDEYRDAQNTAAKKKNGSFDYDAPVEGFVEINDYEFQIVLTKPVTRFRWTLAMAQTSVVSREAVEHYGKKFLHHPVGTAAWMVEDWQRSRHLRLIRNPTYRDEFYPDEGTAEDVERGLTKAAGQKLPIADRLEYRMFAQDQPMWLNFQAKRIDYTQVPDDYFNNAYVKRTQRLRGTYRADGITSNPVVLLDFIFIGFNMKDPVVGGYTPEKRMLRKALSMCLDWDERNDTFYSGINVVYDGMIPPGLEGHPVDGIAPNSPRGPNLEKSRELLAKAGYPGGKGLPDLEYYVSNGSNNKEQAEMLKRQLSKIGVTLKLRLVDFSTLMEEVDHSKAQLFSFAWSSDYPDGENNLALFYSPNRPPGSNHYSYENAKFDRLYEKILTMPPSDERTRIYETMRDIVLTDLPYMGSMARTRFYISHPRLKNFKPCEVFENWPKYLDIEAD